MFLADVIPGLDQAITTLFTQGVLGIGVVIVGYAYFKKDAELRTLHRERIEDAKRFAEIVAENSRTTALNTLTLQGLATMVEKLQKRRTT